MVKRRGTSVVLVLLVLLAAACPAVAAEGATAAADSIRTNIWLVESLMADVVAASIQVLPAAPVRLLLVPRDGDPENELYGATAFRLLSAAGYEIFMQTEADTVIPDHDIHYGYSVAGIDLSYPEVGRTLGLWSNWVERDLAVDAYLQITESPSGRVLLNQRVARSFSDRVPSSDFDSVNSDLYPFTTAETEESGWQRRLEEIVVLGALTGLVVIYFANTSN